MSACAVLAARVEELEAEVDAVRERLAGEQRERYCACGTCAPLSYVFPVISSTLAVCQEKGKLVDV
jgi:hypothetical protein